MSKKTQAQLLKEQLLDARKNGYFEAREGDVAAAFDFAEGYKNFLNIGKTERLCTKEAIRLAVAQGFEQYDPEKSYKAGDKIFVNNRGKAVIFAVIGSLSLKKGVKIAAAHIDSPRLDLKPSPLYEDSDLAYFKTHYYGGIKKYQWTTIPLSLIGVIVKRDGSVVECSIGEGENDPKFVVTDLLPHLAGEQNKRTLSEGIKGEELNILIGSRPFDDSEAAESVKLNIMKILNEKYGITESDFKSAELEAVPAFRACDIGFDRSMIGSYGHDDRVCAYPALMAILNTDHPSKTAVTVLTDKEEIGSEGNTGLQSAYLVNFINDLAKSEGLQGYEVLRESKCLSADVNAAHDPSFPDVSERNNAAFINGGVVITKYTGSRGKSGSNDASAEYMGEIRKMLIDNGIVWQIGELGKVDAGGGGTVAMYIANLDVDTVDLGIPVLSMHAPFEVISKLDVYMGYRAFLEFFK
jgi:aspartyl aminopeptidase